jgi:hypothetical protein
MLHRVSRAAGFLEPCLPSPAKAPPSGADWLHEIKHDGFRILARRDAKGVRLYSRNRLQEPVLLDHLVGEREQRGRNGEAESLGSLNIDHQLELDRLLDRHVGRLLSFENPATVKHPF